jgi:hypothetical protein
MASMAPLAAGICLEVYVVARVIVGSRVVAGIVAAGLLGVFLVFWLLLPRAIRRRRSDSADASSKSVHRTHAG